MTVSPSGSQKKNPALPTHRQVRAVTYEVAGKEKTVFTSLPVARFSAAQVATLYHERWEIELGYRDIKARCSTTPSRWRSKKVDLVYQELWDCCFGYNLVRREASQAAVAHQRAPNEVGFKFACHFIANQMAVMAGALSPAHTPRRLAELRGCIGVMFFAQKNAPGHRDWEGGEDIKDPFSGKSQCGSRFCEQHCASARVASLMRSTTTKATGTGASHRQPCRPPRYRLRSPQTARSGRLTDGWPPGGSSARRQCRLRLGGLGALVNLRRQLHLPVGSRSAAACPAPVACQGGRGRWAPSASITNTAPSTWQESVSRFAARPYILQRKHRLPGT